MKKCAVTDKPFNAGKCARLAACLLFGMQAIGAALGWLLYLFRSRSYYHARVNIGFCYPALDEYAVKRRVRASLMEAGKLFMEMLAFWIMPGLLCGRVVRDIHGEPQLRDALAAGKGVILVLPHLGNWEVFNAYASRFGIVASYKPLQPAWLNRWIKYCRECTGSTLVPIGAQGLKAQCAQLSQGGVIIVLPDQVPDDSAGRVMAEFFGKPAWTGTLVSRLAQRPDVAVFCGFARRLPGCRGFDIFLQAAPEAIYSLDLEVSARALNQGIEACIAIAPEQYLWQYKRFKGGIYPGLYCRSKIKK